MKAISVQQPWASAIVSGWKPIENRRTNFVGSHRGQIAIHASKAWDSHAQFDPRLREQHERRFGSKNRLEQHRFWDADYWYPGHIIGVADLVDVHPSVCDQDTTCCDSPWAEFPYLDRGDGRGFRPFGFHLVLENQHALLTPIPAKGRLGLWSLPVDLELRVGADLWIQEIKARGDG